MERLTAMRGGNDCGPVAIANLLDLTHKMDPEVTYQAIMRDWQFPATVPLQQDLWDSPARHLLILEHLTGSRPGICGADDAPAVVLLRLGWKFHWVTRVSSMVWHDGHQLRTDTWHDRWPAVKVVLAYRPGATGKWPWWTWPWFYLTGLMV